MADQGSRRAIVRLKTRRLFWESLPSRQKYPVRSNCQGWPGAAWAKPGSSLQLRSTVSERGLMNSVNSLLDSWLAGSATVKRRSKSRTSAWTA